ncbi:hypothetical protein BDZ45DRAFT_751936 [Acephala macrosclerotiorum]|nr:hypothetical protein BDZ45DRAFT_751936 [Acephala macrosclerotiorum]
MKKILHDLNIKANVGIINLPDYAAMATFSSLWKKSLPPCMKVLASSCFKSGDISRTYHCNAWVQDDHGICALDPPQKWLAELIPRYFLYILIYFQYLLFGIINASPRPLAVLWLAVAVNIFGANLIPKLNQTILVLSILTFSATTVTLFICSQNSHPNNRLTFIHSISNAVNAYLGSAAGAHLCEEIPNHRKNVPKAIIYPLLMGLITAFPFTCACMFSIVDLDAVLGTATGLPLIKIYYQGTGSKGAALMFMALFAFYFFGCLVGNG